MSPASIRHQTIVGFLLSILQVWIEENELGLILSAPTLMKIQTKPSGREPDIVFVAKENLDRVQKTFIDGAADLVIEIISPESRARDRGDKFYEYEQGGVSEYWLIDPERKQAEFYGLDANGIFQFLTVDKEGLFHSKVLDGLTLQVKWLWQEPLPSLLEVLKNWKLI